MRQELLRWFTSHADRANGQKMSFGTWENIMQQKLGRDAYYEGVCGPDFEADNSSAYSEENEYCEVLSFFGNLLSIKTARYVSIDGDNDTLNWEEFLQWLRTMNEIAKKPPGYYHELLAEEGLNKLRLAKVTYETRTIFKNSASCPSENCGHMDRTEKYKVGRSSETAIAQSTTKTIEANIEASYGSINAGVGATYSTSFSSAVTESRFEEHEET